MDTSTSDSLEDLLLSTNEKSVHLGLELLEQATDPVRYVRLLALIAYCCPETSTGQACRIFLHKNFPQTYQWIQEELDFLTDNWQAAVADKEDYLEELRHFEQFYPSYLERNRVYGQQIYETIARQLITFQQKERAAQYYAGLTRWFPEEANYWYQYAQCQKANERSILHKATSCKNAQAKHAYALALDYWCDLEDADQARQWVQAALTLDSKYAPAHCLLGDLYAAAQQWSLAANAYKEAVKFDTKKASYQNRYAVSLLAQPNLKSELLDCALAHASTAYNHRSDLVLYRTTQAIALWLCAKKQQEAVEILQPSLQTALGSLVHHALTQENPALLHRYFERYADELAYEALT